MMESLMERQVEAALYDALGERAAKLLKGINDFAAKQGGQNALENYKLLGKRALVVAGVAVVVVNVASWAVSSVVSKRMLDKKIEQTVKRVIAEERARQGVEPDDGR